ncbi:hypothetical protein MAPG_02853 [Magnaporthiopsis poae ATCC 64411]|uniref:Uncharacterized protein n=1 Tax=Magnaporthiopsis poae (strain ATCC 64411 / 73-15) TaxID=644358 RepID=A0A0C4DSH3_MAGP6|nr:hypothetical protein MAPG_02853 [Magnaporthiopsis poae ATCC 64411]
MPIVAWTRCCSVVVVFNRAGFSGSFLQPLEPAGLFSPRDEPPVQLHVNHLHASSIRSPRCNIDAARGQLKIRGNLGEQQALPNLLEQATYDDGSRSRRRRHRPSCLIHGSDGRRGPVLQGTSSALFDPWFVRPRKSTSCYIEHLFRPPLSTIRPTALLCGEAGLYQDRTWPNCRLPGF